MLGHIKILAALVFIAGTLAQSLDGDLIEERAEISDPMEETKSDLKANRVFRRDMELEKAQEAEVKEVATVRLQDQAALAAVLGTRRRGGPSNTAIVKPATLRDDARTTTTTTTRTPRDCDVNGVRYAEGSPVEAAGGECQNCFCLHGEVTCTRTTCAPPMDGCKPVMQDGHCCPVKYDCDHGNRRVSVDQFFKDFPVKISTADQRREFERMRPEWQTNMARKSPGGGTIITDTEDEQVSGVGHVGEAFLVKDASSFPATSSVEDDPPFNVDEQIEVGTGVNVKGSLRDAVAFGPILIFDNRVRSLRRDPHQNEVNETEGDVAYDEENTVVTDIPEETTMLTKDDNVDEKIINDDGITNGELSTDYDMNTEELTTLFPIPLVHQTTVKALSEVLSTTTEASTVITTEPPSNSSSQTNDIEKNSADELDYLDIETNFPSYDITVGTSVLATNQELPQATGVGEVISVELKPEHKMPEIESAPELEIERPSLLGTIFNFLTRTERPNTDRPRPSRLPLPPPPPRPPFRVPQPNRRPDNRRPINPSRFRFTPPPAVALEKESVEEPETNTATSPPAPLIIPTTRPTLLAIPTATPGPIVNLPPSGFNRPEPVINTPNRPAPGFNRPEPVMNLPVHAVNRPVVPIPINIPHRPDFLPDRPVVHATNIDSPNGLPSQPVIEGGFQGMRDNEEGIRPTFDLGDYDTNGQLTFNFGDYDTDGRPTLPPSLPNLQIIKFVAADALVNQEIGIAGNEFKVPALVRVDIGDDNHENQTSVDTTEAPTTTTTRRPFHRLPIGDRRPPILPPRRTINRPGDGSSTRRPFLPFRRPGERPSRPPFTLKLSTTTTTTSAPEDEVEASSLPKPKPTFRPHIAFANRDRSSTRPPFIPPRRPTPTTTETTTETTTTTTTTTTTSTTRRPPPLTTTQRPIVSEEIDNLLLQDVFGFTKDQNTPPVRFTPARTTDTPKPIIPVKISTALPEIPSAVRDQLPLATDPILASGLLKLSGCNIYGRMYNVGGKILELSAACKECRCTPVGVQCLPIC